MQHVTKPKCNQYLLTVFRGCTTSYYSMYSNRKIACCKPQRCLLIARAFTFVNKQTTLLYPFFRSKNREKRVGFPKIRTFLGSETASAGSKKQGKAGWIPPNAYHFRVRDCVCGGKKQGLGSRYRPLCAWRERVS